MIINKDYIELNEYSRPGWKLKAVKAIVIHWVAKPNQTASAVRNFFDDRKDGKHDGYGSTQYIVGLGGVVIQTMPADEIAFHCGNSKLDPASGKNYTDLAREKFGEYAIDYKQKSPNSVTIGIEHCHKDWDGTMTEDTINSSVELVALLCREHGLDPMKDILLHKDIVGWKDCHKFFCDNPAQFLQYKDWVRLKMEDMR